MFSCVKTGYVRLCCAFILVFHAKYQFHSCIITSQNYKKRNIRKNVTSSDSFPGKQTISRIKS